jgi:hypothetical protein
MSTIALILAYSVVTTFVSEKVALLSCDEDFWLYRHLLPRVLGVVHLFTREAKDTLMQKHLLS